MGSSRRRATRSPLRAGLSALLVVVACQQQGGTVMGVVTAVDGDLLVVRSFTLLVEGESMTFVPAEDGDFAYPLTHLRDHLRDGTPIRVSWERQTDHLRAVKIDDG